MAANLVRIEGSAPWSASCACGWRCDPMGVRSDAAAAAARHRRNVHRASDLAAARQRRYRASLDA